MAEEPEHAHTQKDIVDLKSTMNQFNIIKIYTILTQEEDTNSVQVPIDYKLGDTRTYPGTMYLLSVPQTIQLEKTLLLLLSRFSRV